MNGHDLPTRVQAIADAMRIRLQVPGEMTYPATGDEPATAPRRRVVGGFATCDRILNEFADQLEAALKETP